MALTLRMIMNEEFEELTSERVFTAVPPQYVADRLA
jgi:hypothetical protein